MMEFNLQSPNDINCAAEMKNLSFIDVIWFGCLKMIQETVSQ